MTAYFAPRRLLFVHAHPDDETLATGLAIAQHRLDGHEVHVLTCTLGEEGEVIPPELAHLADGQGRELAACRLEELRGAAAELGATLHLLRGPQDDPDSCRYRDSGMAGTPSVQRPDAFSAAPLAEVAALVEHWVRALRPDVVVSYDAQGGYLHPDHIRAHQAARAALSNLPRQRRPLLYAAATPRSWARQDREWVLEHVREQGLAKPGLDDPYPPSVVADDLPATLLAASPAAVAARDAALRCHRTQAVVYAGHFALSSRIAARLTRREAYLRLDVDTGEPRPPDPAAGPAPDLVAAIGAGAEPDAGSVP